MITTAPSLSNSKLSCCSSSSLLGNSLLHSKLKRFPFAPNSLSLSSADAARCIVTQMKGLKIKTTGLRCPGFIHASGSEPSPTLDAAEERWLLEPIGDGDTRHIGFKVEMPAAFEIASKDVTVGRLPEKADMVIPVATVSGVHARIQKKGGELLVTDLDSTNGTFIDKKRLRPGVAVAVSSGSCIIFGDTHLAMFRAFKLENTKPAREPSPEKS